MVLKIENKKTRAAWDKALEIYESFGDDAQACVRSVLGEGRVEIIIHFRDGTRIGREIFVDSVE